MLSYRSFLRLVSMGDKMSHLICTIDPGLSGAICFMNMQRERVRIFDMPILKVVRNGKNKREIDHYALADIFSYMAPMTIRAYVEKVGAMPNQGSTSMFTFGTTYGSVRQAVASAGIPQESLSPPVWKKAMQIRKGKHGMIMRAKEVLPQLKDWWPLMKNEGRATAALMCVHAIRMEGRMGAV